MWNSETLTGRSEAHLVPAPAELDGRDDRSSPFLLHPGAVSELATLREAGLARGIDLKVASGFRPFARQRSIWNRKVSGELKLRNRAGEVVSPRDFAPAALLELLSTWSALPGASRHHWGTDVDVFDAAARPEGYEVQLVPEEYAPGGPFAKLGAWLDELAAAPGFAFARPYFGGEGKKGRRACPVAPEPWHLSARSPARGAQEHYDPAVLRALLADPAPGEEIALADEVLADFEGYFREWILSGFVS
ncbi:MAG: M15 family metallopeptidase [Fibrobacterales bacterium]|nr:M15 family metallopeptidase [Fibrobacterales bacterium]